MASTIAVKPRPRARDIVCRPRFASLVPALLANRMMALSLLLPFLASVFLFTPTTLSLQSFSSVETADVAKAEPAFGSEKVISREQPKVHLLPLPTSYTTGDTVLCLSHDFQIRLDTGGYASGAAPKDLLEAIDRTEKHLWSNRHQYLSVKRGEEFFNRTTGEGCGGYLGDLILSLAEGHAGSGESIASIMASAIRPAEERAELEEYYLSVPIDGPAKLEAATALGLYRGLTTFEQLFYHMPKNQMASGGPAPYSSVLSQPHSLSGESQLPLGPGGESGTSTGQTGTGPSTNPGLDTADQVYAPTAPYEIKDKPSFGWRAVLLDTSRNWFGLPAIRKMLDTMSTVKLNVFHWHITDSNSWPLDLVAYPELAQNAAYSQGQKYTEEEIRQLIAYAGARGIDVVLEIDTPGHTATIAPSHPDLIACFEATPFAQYAHQPPPGQLRFADSRVAEWTKGLFSATLGIVASNYFGTGGDEINNNCMLTDTPTTAILEANQWTLDDALNDFTGRTHAAILEQSKTPMVWQEMVLDHGIMPALSRETLVSIWVNSADARRVLDKGFKIVHAAADYFYLDCGQGGWIAKDGGGNSWCDPFKSWARMYSFNPYQDVEDAQKKLVVGGQTSLWAEQTDETNFEQVLWPRAAAVAELFWTGASEGGYPRSAVEALPRMHDARYRMVDRGVQAEPLQPHWCALRPGVCVDGQ